MNRVAHHTTALLRLASACLGLAIAAATPALSGPERLTLERALELALADNYTLQAKQNELKSVRTGEITADLSPNPQAGYTASNLGGRAGNFGRTDNQYTLQATIETARKRERRVDLAKAGTRITGFELDDVRRTLILQVKTAFIGVLAGLVLIPVPPAPRAPNTTI